MLFNQVILSSGQCRCQHKHDYPVLQQISEVFSGRQLLIYLSLPLKKNRWKCAVKTLGTFETVSKSNDFHFISHSTGDIFRGVGQKFLAMSYCVYSCAHYIENLHYTRYKMTSLWSVWNRRLSTSIAVKFKSVLLII